MIVKAKDLQVGDVIAGNTVYSVQSAILFTLVHLKIDDLHYSSEFPNEMEINVERAEYVKVDKNLIVLAARYLRKEGYHGTAWELEALLENSTTKC